MHASHSIRSPETTLATSTMEIAHGFRAMLRDLGIFLRIYQKLFFQNYYKFEEIFSNLSETVSLKRLKRLSLTP